MHLEECGSKRLADLATLDLFAKVMRIWGGGGGGWWGVRVSLCVTLLLCLSHSLSLFSLSLSLPVSLSRALSCACSLPRSLALFLSLGDLEESGCKRLADLPTLDLFLFLLLYYSRNLSDTIE